MCQSATFRSTEVTKCTPCPLNSKSAKLASAYCPCKDGYYRHPRDGKHMPCYRPPGPPTNLTLLFMDQTSAILSWNAPKRSLDDQIDKKYRSDIVFKVKCPTCNSNAVFNPSTDTFNDTKLTLTNLEPVTTYTIQVHSMNGISYSIQSDSNETYDSTSSSDDKSNSHHSSNANPLDESLLKTEYAEITFTTESAILSTVFNTRIVGVTSKEVDLVWDKPVHSDSPIEFYEVRWFPKTELDSINKTTFSTKDSKAHIDNLLENTEYGFQVRCKTLNGYGTYSNIVYTQTHQSVSPGTFPLIIGCSNLFVEFYLCLFSVRWFDANANRCRCNSCRCYLIGSR